MADAPELSASVSAPTSASTLALAVRATAGTGSGPAKNAIQELLISTLNIPIHLTCGEWAIASHGRLLVPLCNLQCP
jgi:hypothetical protein